MNQLIAFTYSLLLLLYVLTGLMKAKFHLEYLKLIEPQKYKEDEGLLSAFAFKYRLSIQLLFFPIFTRERENANALILAKKTMKTMIINCVILFLLLLPHILWFFEV